MDERHVRLIRENMDRLIPTTNRLDSIIEKLSERKVLNEYMVKHLMKNKERRKRNSEFYEMIQGRGPTAFDNLLSALRETENFTAEQILSVYKVESYDNRVSSEPVIERLVLSEDIPDGSEEELVVKTHPDKKLMDIDEENLPNGTYRMRSKPRGHALIINIYRTLQHDDRIGSEVDTRRLKKLFTELGYKVSDFVDCELNEMKKEIKKFSSNPELSKVDSVVVFIMAHGQAHSPNDRSVDLIASDNKPLNTNWIAERFTKTNSCLVTRSSERKPKLLFFQACRVPNTGEQKVNISYPKTVEIDSVVISESKSITNRDFEDMYQVFSTVTGYVSMRDPARGAWFVDKFCEIVAKNAYKYDLDTMLGMVDDEVRKLNSPTVGYQTLDVTKQGVSKKLFFNPGL